MKERLLTYKALIDSDLTQMEQATTAVDGKLRHIEKIMNECHACAKLISRKNINITQLYDVLRDMESHPAKATDTSIFYLQSLINALESGADFVADIYQGMEDIFKRVAELTGETLPSGEHWHADLLTLMSASLEGMRGPVIGEKLLVQLKKNFLGFRHLTRKNYPFILYIGLTLDKMNSCASVVKSFKTEISNFMESTLSELKQREMELGNKSELPSSKTQVHPKIKKPGE